MHKRSEGFEQVGMHDLPVWNKNYVVCKPKVVQKPPFMLIQIFSKLLFLIRLRNNLVNTIAGMVSFLRDSLLQICVSIVHSDCSYMSIYYVYYELNVEGLLYTK